MTEERPGCFRAIVRGRVQGVNFRSFVFTRAGLLHLNGYVRNLPDGRSLEVVAEGERADLERLLVYLDESPRLSRIDAIEVEWGDATSEHDAFTVAG